MQKTRLFFLTLSIAFSACVLSLLNGSQHLSWQALLDNQNGILLDIRLPRTLTAFITGSLLALAGALMQLLLRNPLADPYVLGISGGAALTTLAGLLLGWSEEWLLGSAWLGSIAVIGLILLLARQHRWQSNTLLLIGVALSCGFSALISFILLISQPTYLHNMLFWLNGDLNDAAMPWLGGGILAGGLITCYALAPGLTLFARGDMEARALGLPTQHYRFALFLLSSLLTATAVTLAGSIGFVGLIVPQVVRRWLGFDQRLVLPVTALAGGCLLTLADTGARTLLAPQQIPVGLVMTLLGIPVFVWLLQK
jgi:iron complex transport system permease protein